jgi:hypothetical protein
MTSKCPIETKQFGLNSAPIPVDNLTSVFFAMIGTLIATLVALPMCPLYHKSFFGKYLLLEIGIGVTVLSLLGAYWIPPQTDTNGCFNSRKVSASKGLFAMSLITCIGYVILLLGCR